MNFDNFEIAELSLDSLRLDPKNPRIVTPKPVKTQEAIVCYLAEHEDLQAFVNKIASEGFNDAAEKPYVVKSGTKYVVKEGNTRVAAYKLLTRSMKVPENSDLVVPEIGDNLKDKLKKITCSIAPNEQAVLPIMAKAHFGLGDKSRWGYLGSRKAIYTKYSNEDYSVHQLSKAFGKSEGDIKDYIIEYLLYIQATKFQWTEAERAALTKPSVEFNPPVRFLQGSTHKSKIGISFDKVNLEIDFESAEAKKRYKHLIKKLVIEKGNGLGATSLFEEVFKDYLVKQQANPSSGGASIVGGGNKGSGSGKGKLAASPQTKKTQNKPNALFQYEASINDALVKKLMDEAKKIHIGRLPSSATILLRTIVESLLRHIIHQQNLNPQNKDITLHSAIIMVSGSNALNKTDKKVLADFSKHHVQYLNLGAHGNVIPTRQRLETARDAIDPFIKKYV